MKYNSIKEFLFDIEERMAELEDMNNRQAIANSSSVKANKNTQKKTRRDKYGKV